MRVISRKQIIFLASAIVFMIIFFSFQFYKDTKYINIDAGYGYCAVPKRVFDKCEGYSCDDYTVLQSDGYFIVGIGPDCKSIESSVLDALNISYKDIEKVNSIKYPDELNCLIGANGVIVNKSKTVKPSYELFFLQYRLDDCDEMVFVYRSENKNVIEIVVSPMGDISQSEINYMFGNISY